MAKNQAECLVMICHLPRIFKQGNISPMQIYIESNYEQYFEQISIESTLHEIQNDPILFKEWFEFSQDKRCIPSWALEEKNGKWSLSYIQINGKSSSTFIYENKLLACAHMIKAEMEQMRSQ